MNGVCIVKAQRITSGPEWVGNTTVTMPYSKKNRATLDKYEELVKKHYPEPEDGKLKDPFSHFRSGHGQREI